MTNSLFNELANIWNKITMSVLVDVIDRINNMKIGNGLIELEELAKIFNAVGPEPVGFDELSQTITVNESDPNQGDNSE